MKSKNIFPLLSLTVLILSGCSVGKKTSSGAESKECCTLTTSDTNSSQSESTSSGTQTSSSSTKESQSETTSESQSQTSTSESQSESSSSQSESSSQTESTSSSSSSSSSHIESDFALTTSDGAFDQVDNIYTITAAGSYSATGNLYGQIVVNAGDDDAVEIELTGVHIEYDLNSPILCLNADKVEISAKKDTTNQVIDNRSVKLADSDEQGEGAISSKCDLKLKGKGSLSVIGNYNNGVHTSDDLEIKNLTVVTTAVNNAYKGKDSLTIESGKVTAYAGGNAFKTDNTDISSKTEKQRGIITVLDGTINAYSAYDAFDAAYNLDIQGGKINVFTNKYAEDYIDIDTEVSTTYLYLRTTSYASSSRYSLYCYDNEGNYTWADASYLNSQSGKTTYYYYRLKCPTGYDNFKIYRFSSTAENSTETYQSVSSGNTFNRDYDMLTFSVSGSTINVTRWSNYSSSQQPGGPGGGPGQEGNNDKSTDSAKAFKAANEIYISGGTISAKTYDDAIHANAGDTFDNGETGLGNVNISGGELSLYASDDGIHADNKVNISGGTIDITYSYEGIEGKTVEISDGNINVWAKDDGLNATSDTGSASITVSGGRVDITVGSGDVDGIDSNGSFTQSGGIIITRGAPGYGGGMASGLDVDGTAKITGGTFISVGKLEVTPSRGSGVYLCTFGSNTTFSQGTWTISTLDISFDLTSSYTGYVKVFSSSLTSGTSYTLSNGTSSYTAKAS